MEGGSGEGVGGGVMRCSAAAGEGGGEKEEVKSRAMESTKPQNMERVVK